MFLFQISYTCTISNPLILGANFTKRQISGYLFRQVSPAEQSGTERNSKNHAAILYSILPVAR
jgi:hypothetical protein